MATGFGLQLLGTLHGFNAHISQYDIPASDSTATYVGDIVMITPTTGAMNAAIYGMAANTMQTVAQGVSSDILLGVVVGFLPDPTSLLSDNYRHASTHRVALVCDDPDAIYAVQEDAVGGSLTAAQIGSMYNCNLIVAAGNNSTGYSGIMLDSSTSTASAADVKIVGVYEAPNNVAAQSGGAIIKVRVLSSALNATDSQS